MATHFLVKWITRNNLRDKIDYLAGHRLIWIKEPKSDWGR